MFSVLVRSSSVYEAAPRLVLNRFSLCPPFPDRKTDWNNIAVRPHVHTSVHTFTCPSTRPAAEWVVIFADSIVCDRATNRFASNVGRITTAPRNFSQDIACDLASHCCRSLPAGCCPSRPSSFYDNLSSLCVKILIIINLK